MSLVFFYDIKKICLIIVLGLCGNFDDNKDNDRMMSDGTLYTGKSKRTVQFSKSWRFVVFFFYCFDITHKLIDSKLEQIRVE